MKRLLAVVLTLVMVVTLLAVPAIAEEDGVVFSGWNT